MSTHSQRRLFITGTLLISSVTICQADSLWPSFDQLFDHMDEMFERHMEFARDMYSQTRDAFATTHAPSKGGVTAEINDDKEKVAVVVNGIGGDEIDARLNEHNDTLTITTRDSKIVLNLHRPARSVTSLAVNVRQEQRETEEPIAENDTDAKEGNEAAKRPQAVRSSHAVSVSSIATTVAGRLNLDDNIIEYDETAERLTINIPKPTQPTGKKIAINVVNPAIKKETEVEEKTA